MCPLLTELFTPRLQNRPGHKLHCDITLLRANVHSKADERSSISRGAINIGQGDTIGVVAREVAEMIDIDIDQWIVSVFNENYVLYCVLCHKTELKNVLRNTSEKQSRLTILR